MQRGPGSCDPGKGLADGEGRIFEIGLVTGWVWRHIKATVRAKRKPTIGELVKANLKRTESRQAPRHVDRPRVSRAAALLNCLDNVCDLLRVLSRALYLGFVVLKEGNGIRFPSQVPGMQFAPSAQRCLRRTRDFLAINPAPERAG